MSYQGSEVSRTYRLGYWLLRLPLKLDLGMAATGLAAHGFIAMMNNGLFEQSYTISTGFELPEVVFPMIVTTFLSFLIESLQKAENKSASRLIYRITTSFIGVGAADMLPLIPPHLHPYWAGFVSTLLAGSTLGIEAVTWLADSDKSHEQ